MKSRIPLHIIAGFLGVGKTTAILDILRQLADKEHVAVVVNERGKIGLDGAVVASSNESLEIREVTGGCVCCTAGLALEKSLREIVDKVRPDRILMEPSGIAKPGEIIDLMNQSDMYEQIDIRPLVGLVDPGHFTKSEIMQMPIYRDQVEAADILVANRCDLTDGATLKSFYQKARELFPPKGAILTTSFGKLPEEILTVAGDSFHRLKKDLSLRDHLGREESRDIVSGEPKHDMFDESGWIWEPGTVFSHDKLSKTFETLRSTDIEIHGKVERAKGAFHTEKGWYLMELALDTISQRPIQYRKDNRCLVILSDGTDSDTRTLEHLLKSCISNRVHGRHK
jgi:G3E family GTPase